MGSGIVTIESTERFEPRRTPLTTWLQIANIVTLAIVSLLIFKIFQACVALYRWMMAPEPNYDHIRTILFLGPKTELNLHLLRELSQKFNTPALPVQDPSLSPWKTRSRILLFGNVGGSREDVLALYNSVVSAHGPVDLLIVSEQEDQSADPPQPTHFLNNLNRQLLAQFWIVTAFLPGMLSRNRGSIMSVALDRTTSLANAGVMRTVYEDVLQKNSQVTLTLVERNSFMDRFLPGLPPFLLASIAMQCIGKTQVAHLPTFIDYFITVPVLLSKMYLKPVKNFFWSTRTRSSSMNR